MTWRSWWDMWTFLWHLLRVNVQLLIWHESLLNAQYTFREVLTSLTMVGHNWGRDYVLRRAAVVKILNRVISEDRSMSCLTNDSVVFLNWVWSCSCAVELLWEGCISVTRLKLRKIVSFALILSRTTHSSLPLHKVFSSCFTGNEWALNFSNSTFVTWAIRRLPIRFELDIDDLVWHKWTLFIFVRWAIIHRVMFCYLLALRSYFFDNIPSSIANLVIWRQGGLLWS